MILLTLEPIGRITSYNVCYTKLLRAIIVNGVKPSGTANPDLKWEESEQTDLGVDFGFLNNALTFTADYYVKNTNGMLKEMVVPSYLGESKPTGNVGTMINKGVELEANYRFKVSGIDSYNFV